jgi:hypothetical protein
MLKTTEDYVAGAILVVLFCPALYGLAVALFKAKQGKVDSKHEKFRSGLTIHAINALLSPCIPAYLLYVDNRTGGGSMASILSLPVLPLTWFLFVVGSRRVAKAEATEE